MVTTSERLVKMETEVKELKNRNTDEHKEIKKMIQDFIISADNKYAPKYIEKLNLAVMVAFVGAVITKLVGLW